MKICRDGVTRIVLLAGRYAIKFPRFGYGWDLGLRGLLCNMQERTFARAGWPELCPVLWALPGGWVLVMRRARPLTDAEWETLPVDFGHEYDETGELLRMVPVERKADSFGVVEGRIVAVDYGS